MQRSHRHHRTAVVAALACALFVGTTVVSADDAVPAITPVGGTARFPQYAVPATLDLSNLPSQADDDTEVSAVVQIAGDSALTLAATAAASNQRVDPTAAERQVRDGQQGVTDQLQAAGATIEGNITTVLNAVRVRVKVKDLPGLANIAGVTNVHVSRTITLDNANSNAYTGVNAVWEDLGLTGEGITIAIIDDGIDYYHADFGGVGGAAAYEADSGLEIEPGTFPTAKVVAGYDFAGDAYDAEADEPGESPVPVPDPDPLACGEHGTHVAGTAAGAGVLADGSTFAGPYDATTMSNEFSVAPGAAPQAFIQSYKVFGCSGSSDDDVILAAIDAAVANGADVVNMSLGSTFGSADEPLALAVDAASAAGVVMVLSAGNEGPGAYVLGGPSAATSAISVAAVDAVPMIPGVSVTGAVTLVAQNSNAYEFVAPITGELIDVGLGCTPEELALAAGKIAIATRGTCDRVARAILGTQAGALAVIFKNDGPGLPPVEGEIPDAGIPFVGVTPEDGELFQAAQGQMITLDNGPEIANPGYQHLASFTSNGPRTNDSALKPDIAAPGVNVLSALAGSGDGSVLLSGTSMASPHTAGIAALVQQAHPDWSPAQIKSAMMSTAVPEGVSDYSARRAGAGLVQARQAVDTVAYISTKDGLNNLSFGFEEIGHSRTITRSFQITNTSGASITYDLGAGIDDAGTGATISVNPSAIKVPGGQTRTVTVKLHIPDPALIPSAADDDGGALAAIDGFVVATPRQAGAGIGRLVTPLLMVPGSLSNVRATPVRQWSHGNKFPVPNRIKLYNSGTHAGDADFYQWAITDSSHDSPDPRVPDIRDVGVQSFPFDDSGPLLVFAINLAKPYSTQSTGEFDIYIDTDGDDIEDFILIVVDTGLLTTGTPDGTMSAALFTPEFEALSLFGAVAPANGTTIEAAVPAGAMGNPGLIAFGVVTYTILDVALDSDVTDIGYYDASQPAVHAADPADPDTNFPFVSLAPKQYVPIQVSIDRREAYKQHALGWLIVTTDDGAGAREADRVPIHG